MIFSLNIQIIQQEVDDLSIFHTFVLAEAIFSLINNDAVSCEACVDANKLLIFMHTFVLSKKSIVVAKSSQFHQV